MDRDITSSISRSFRDSRRPANPEPLPNPIEAFNQISAAVEEIPMTRKQLLGIYKPLEDLKKFIEAFRVLSSTVNPQPPKEHEKTDTETKAPEHQK